MAHDHPPAGGGGEKKKSLGERLAGIALAVLLFVIFLYVLDGLVPMAFGAGTSLVGGIATGVQNISTGLMRANVSVSLFTTALLGLMIRILIIIMGIALSAKLGQAIAAWMRPAPAHH
jgi:hypothetical protein